MTDVTQILSQIESGDPSAAEKLLPLVYEALRMIREQDPLKPSTKVSSLGNKTQFISQLRCTDARSLSKSIRGDLDWIVMKALEKDRKRRYETASLLGDELIRFLDNKPVEACPPSAI